MDSSQTDHFIESEEKIITSHTGTIIEIVYTHNMS